MCQSTKELGHCRGLTQHETKPLLRQMSKLRPMKWSDVPQDTHIWSEIKTWAVLVQPPGTPPIEAACRLPLWARVPCFHSPLLFMNCSLTALSHQHLDVKGVRCRVRQGDLARWQVATKNPHPVAFSFVNSNHPQLLQASIAPAKQTQLLQMPYVVQGHRNWKEGLETANFSFTMEKSTARWSRCFCSPVS